MYIEQFSIRNHPQKALIHVECSSVPGLMIIAGPNGVGKSTLLEVIAHDFEVSHPWMFTQFSSRIINEGGYLAEVKVAANSPQERALYLTAHRIWTPLGVSPTSLMGQQNIKVDEAYSVYNAVATNPNIQKNRHATDTSFDIVKKVLLWYQVRADVAAISILRANKLTTQQINDLTDRIFEPLRELLNRVLPQLELDKVDASPNSPTGGQCLFKKIYPTYSVQVELDDLSSGERAVISLFMPFIESRMDAYTRQLEVRLSEEPSIPPPPMTMLIDEPEIHLHPHLQTLMLKYMRELVVEKKGQFILATQSSTLIGMAEYAELYTVTPPTYDPEYNQLIQIADSNRKLDVMRELCGDTYVLTAARNIICIEGEAPSIDRNVSTDIRIFELLCPELSNNYSLLPFKGKSQVIVAAERLRSFLSPHLQAVISVEALVDADTDPTDLNKAFVRQLPVAMIENWLLNVEAIWNYLEPHRESTSLRSVQDVAVVLDQIAKEQRNAEIELRVKRKMSSHTIFPTGISVPEIRENLTQQIAKAQSSLPTDGRLMVIIGTASQEVDQIIIDGTMLKHFRGKGILAKFREKYLHKLNLSHAVLCTEIARYIGSRPSLRQSIYQELGKLFELPPMINDVELTPSMEVKQ